MIDRLFLKHPRSVGESYGEHLGVATRFGAAMISGGLKALVHGIFPSLFQTSGSETVIRLHATLVEKRGHASPTAQHPLSVE